jgi:hypothetical protein
MADMSLEHARLTLKNDNCLYLLENLFTTQMRNRPKIYHLSTKRCSDMKIDMVSLFSETFYFGFH